MRSKPIFMWVALTVLANPGWASDEPAAVDCHGTAPRICLAPDASATSMVILLTVPVGATSEAVGEDGLAHYVEHLMFRGRADDPASRLNGIDRFGNAYTSLWATTYYWDVSPEQAPEAVERALSVFAPLTASPLEAAQEQQIVARERERQMARASGASTERLNRALLADTRADRTVIGTQDNIATLDLAAAQSFHARHYMPDGATVVVAGNIAALDHAAIRARMPDQTTNTATRTAQSVSLDPDPRAAVSLTETARIATYRRVEVRLIRGVPADYPTVVLLDNWFSSSLAGTPGRALVRGRRDVQSFGATVSESVPGLLRFAAVMAMRPDQEPQARDAAWAAWTEHRDEIIETCPAADMVERLKARELRSIDRQRTDAVASAWSLVKWLEHGMGVADWRAHPEAVAAVTPDAVCALSQRLGDPIRTVNMDLNPTSPDETIDP